jgi:hypothetical protein
MYPRYALPAGLIGRVALAVLAGQRRAFRADAQRALAGLRPPLVVLGSENLPAAGPCLLTINHYHRPGFPAWWLALALSSVAACEIHWIMTSAWTYTDPLGRWVLAPAMRRLLGRLAQVYGFTPMPPEATEVEGRARAVRQVLHWARRAPRPVIGLAPEGRDAPGGVLQRPPPGTGRFICHLAGMGLRLTPVGAYEAEGALCLRVGAAYRLEPAIAASPEQRDRQTSELVMRRVAGLLPAALRGEFG